MTTNQFLNCQLETLRQCNLWIRQQLELAEAKIPAVNEQIDQLARTNLLESEAILGDVINTRAYTNQPESDGGLLMQAALLIPGGVGLLDWDRDDYLSINESFGPSFSEARHRFREFDRLEPALKAMLVPHVEALVNRLISKAFPPRPDPPPAITGWTAASTRAAEGA